MSNAKESTTLYYRAENSDKVYMASIEETAGGFTVNIAYGRRGSTFQTGSKTSSPVPLEKAKEIYDKLIREKMAKGYSPGESGTPYVQTDKEQRATGLNCQLLNAIDADAVDRLLQDGSFWAQEKKDGKRVLIRFEAGAITGINRKGLSIGLPSSIEKRARELGTDKGAYVLDGECIGDRLFAFDMLSMDGKDLRQEPYARRLEQLCAWIGNNGPIAIVETARSTQEKRSLLKTLKDQRREGLVFKNHAAPYTAGRPNSGGSQLKFKFYATATLLVAKANVGKRSVALAAFDGKKQVGLGNVTIPPNTPVPAAGSIIEARYLYAFEGGSLFQPTFLGLRTDIDASACLTAQLKYRATDEDDEAL